VNQLRRENLLSLECTAHTLHVVFFNGRFTDILRIKLPPNLDSLTYHDTFSAHLPLAMRLVGDLAIDAVAYSCRPGIEASLLACERIARTLALIKRARLVPVDHCLAHIEAVRALARVARPFIGIHASGGNTTIYTFSIRGRVGTYREVWRIHPGVGWLLDEIAKILGDRPRVINGLHVAHHLLRDTEPDPHLVRKLERMVIANKVRLALLVARREGRRGLRSLIDAAYRAVTRIALQASARVATSLAILGGGVSLCPVMRESVQRAFREVVASPPELATDNAYMIAIAALTSAGRNTVDTSRDALIQKLFAPIAMREAV